MNTIYLMGSVMYSENLDGLVMKVTDDTGGSTTCPDVDGSGFYDCKAEG